MNFILIKLSGVVSPIGQGRFMDIDMEVFPLVLFGWNLDTKGGVTSGGKLSFGSMTLGI